MTNELKPIESNNYMQVVYEPNRQQFEKNNANSNMYCHEINSLSSNENSNNKSIYEPDAAKLAFNNSKQSESPNINDAIYFNKASPATVLIPNTYFNPTNVSSSNSFNEGFNNLTLLISGNEINSNLIVTNPKMNNNNNYYDSSNSMNKLQQQQQQQQQLQAQQMQQKKITKKRSNQMASEIDEERTSQLVSEILKNIKEKTKELENMNQNLKSGSDSKNSGKLAELSHEFEDKNQLLSNIDYVDEYPSEQVISNKTKKVKRNKNTTRNSLENICTNHLNNQKNNLYSFNSEKRFTCLHRTKNTFNKKKAKDVPAGWNRTIETVNNEKFVVYTSPSGIKIKSIQEIKYYLLSDNTCKCGLECPINIYEVFSFDIDSKTHCKKQKTVSKIKPLNENSDLNSIRNTFLSLKNDNNSNNQTSQFQ